MGAAHQDAAVQGVAPQHDEPQQSAAEQQPPAQPAAEPQHLGRHSSVHSEPGSPLQPPSPGIEWPWISRKMSTSSAGTEEFERTAMPMESNAFGNSGTSTLPVTTGLSFSDPSKEIVLRIEVSHLARPGSPAHDERRPGLAQALPAWSLPPPMSQRSRSATHSNSSQPLVRLWLTSTAQFSARPCLLPSRCQMILR